LLVACVSAACGESASDSEDQGDAGAGNGGGAGVSGAAPTGGSGAMGGGGAANGGSGAVGGGGAGNGGSGAVGGGGAGMGGSGATGALCPDGDPENPRILARGSNVFTETPPQQCARDADCMTGERCYQMTDDISICSVERRPEATACTPEMALTPGASDECGCEGLTCDAGETCVSIAWTCSCGGGSHNGCVSATCAPTDCDPGTVCTPGAYVPATGRCTPAACQRDSDCPSDSQCSVFVSWPLQAGEQSISVRCISVCGDAPDA
jgi:hypothetical protein